MNAAKAAQPSKGLPEAMKAEAARHGAGDATAGADKRDAKSVVELVAGTVPAGQKAEVFEIYSHAYDSVSKREDLVDAASEMSFPASDPPSYMGGASVIGAPESEAPREKANTKVTDTTDVKPVKDD